jgi:hypothetical protein
MRWLRRENRIRKKMDSSVEKQIEAAAAAAAVVVHNLFLLAF